MTGQPWLRDYLIRSGRVTETGVGRSAKLRRCRECRAQVLAGLDADMCALEVAVDPTPMSPLGEALALLEGRRTLALHYSGGRWELDGRPADDIADRPAGTTPREDVLRQHRCSDTQMADVLTALSKFPEINPTTATETPPF